MSDWIGTYSTAESIKAGLDLEMPYVSLQKFHNTLLDPREIEDLLLSVVLL